MSSATDSFCLYIPVFVHCYRLFVFFYHRSRIGSLKSQIQTNLISHIRDFRIQVQEAGVPQFHDESR